MTTLTFREPLAGLEPHTEYDFAPLAGAIDTYTLRAHEQPLLRLFVVGAATYMPDYAPDLAATELPQARVFLVVTPHAAGVTANLLAPILIDETAGAAAQIIVADDLQAIQVPLRKSA